MKKNYTLLFAFFFLTTSYSQADSSVFVINQKDGRLRIEGKIWVLEDTTNDLSIEDIITAEWRNQFIPLVTFPEKSPPMVNAGVMYLAPEGRNNWFHITIRNELLSDTFLLFPFSMGTTANYGDAYIIRPDGKIEKKRFGKLEALSSLSMEQVHPIAQNLRRLLIPFDLKKGETIQIFIQYKHDSRFGCQLYCRPIIISSSYISYLLTPFRDWYRKRAFYQGILWMFICFSLLNALLRRDLAYLFYGLYIVCLSLLMSYHDFENTLQLFVFPDHPLLSYWLYNFGAGGALVFYLLFLQVFLQSNHELPRWNKGVRILTITGALVTIIYQVFALFPLYHFGYKINYIYVLSIFILSLCGFAYIAYLIRWKNRLAAFIVTGSSILFLSSIVYTFSIIGLLQQFGSIKPIDIMKGGIVLEMLIFSMGLVYRDRKIELEKLKMEEIDRLKTNLFANIAHELRTPLTLIKAPLEDLLLSKKAKGLENDFLIMHQNTERLLGLVNQLLDLSRLEAGVLKLEPTVNDINAFLRQLAGNFHSLAEQKQFDFQVDIPKELLYLNFDVDKIADIVINLLSNAMKFAPKNGWVTIKATYTHQLLIEIGNNGEAIPVSEQPKLFDRFYQTGTIRHQGTGIGLALVQELVVLHQGKIGLKSDLETGTWFWVSLPLKQEELCSNDHLSNKSSRFFIELPENKQAKLQYENDAKNGKKPILLLVEDHEDVRTYIRSKLIQTYQIIEATNGSEGVEKAFEYLPDIIISDVMMPKMDGVELCEIIKNDHKTDHIPIILLTAKTDIESRLTGLETGADDYLAKPFNSKELLVRSQNLINQRKKLQERLKHKINLFPSGIDIQSAEHKFIKKAIDLIEINLSNSDFTVDDFARGMFLSRVHLHRKLKAIADMPASEFIRNLRLDRAAQLLEGKADTVAQIAFQVGFNNLSYFSKCFKQRYNSSPSEYKILKNR